MIYRRFGRTELKMPVLSCGGMRYQQSWSDTDHVSAESQRNLEACITRALELGINHIETARGYGTSEAQLGQILPKLPRERLIVQTKVSPEADPRRFVETFERSMTRLRLDHVDLFALHGVNNEETLEWSLRPGGCLDAALELKKQGRVRWVGFSTHAPLHVILAMVQDGRCDYMNLHWYYVNQLTWPAIQAAAAQDMGVFIISPTDKGGKLYEPSDKLVRLCEPLSPIVFNDLFCLARPEVHTISVGAARPSDFDEHMKVLPHLADAEAARAALDPVVRRLDAELERTLGREWLDTWDAGLPEWDEVPGEVNIHEILRLYNYAVAFDMKAYGKMRYNLLGGGGHWHPGNRADRVGELDLSGVLARSPHRDRIPGLLREAHVLLAGQEVKRLGKH
ncbi:aldo/keto reductase [Sorangium cellulosum]|uniref:Aldo/keto reductase n=1 Tax=Sorangium cellulosum TaxID=56 RepID=A0A2L0F6R8_SORCE|nr:aldo/keto reductase [Sorangium cellulosum]AUX47278.1 aldo/keto reductase [Sorangium cellulosum]